MPEPPEHHEEERLSALLDDELEEQDALEVTRHLARCDRCLAELDQIRAARDALRALPRIDPPPGLFSSIADAATRARSRRRRLLRSATGAAALAALAFASLAALMAGSQRDVVVPPVEHFVVQHVSRSGGGPILAPVDLPGR